jgi:hypothetical protein
MVETSTRTRVVILRDDLSIQFDADVDQNVFDDESEKDRRFERLLTDDPRNLRVQWHEFAPGAPYEPLENTFCEEPTHEVVLVYLAESDSYRVKEILTLDPNQARPEECDEEAYDEE